VPPNPSVYETIAGSPPTASAAVATNETFRRHKKIPHRASATILERPRSPLNQQLPPTTRGLSNGHRETITPPCLGTAKAPSECPPQIRTDTYPSGLVPQHQRHYTRPLTRARAGPPDHPVIDPPSRDSIPTQELLALRWLCSALHLTPAEESAPAVPSAYLSDRPPWLMPARDA